MATEPATPGGADSFDEAPLTPPVPVASGAVAAGLPAPGPTPAAAPAPRVSSPTRSPGSLGRPRCPICGERFSRGSRFCAFDGTRLAEAPEDAPSDPLVGQTLGGKYTVVGRIGEGGMGTVYEVRHASLDRRFALKLLRPEIAQNEEHMARFLQEAKAAAAIGHPNIVTVSDFGEHEVGSRKIPFFVMEFLRGASLASVLKAEKTLPPKRAAKIIAACAEALAAAHAAGVIHRDLKPDNIFLGGEAADVPKVLDFGVAKMSGAARLTQIGMVFGTPHYMSPEQARGQAIDHRTDIYALGVILYECLSGRVPFEADTSMGVLTKQIFANPEPIERIAPDPRALGALGTIVMRCLAKEPADRYATMDELAAAIRQVVADPSAAAASSLGAGQSVFPKRAGLRLREETALPRSRAPVAEPAPRAWGRLLAYAGAAVAVLALIAVSVRALVLSGSGVTPAPGDPTGSQALATSAAASPGPAPPSSSTAAPLDAPAQPEPAASLTGSGAGTATQLRAPSGPSSVPTATSGSPKPTSGVVDPWNNRPSPTKKPVAGVVDPWADKPRK